jgi:uncharacterized protein YndB with AHSA1/START domain
MNVRREVVLPADRDEVWRALTEPERLEEWFASEAVLDPTPGGTGRFAWGDGEAREAVVETVDEGRLLVFRWSAPEDVDAVSRVAIRLDEHEDGTRLTVTETALGPRAALGEWCAAASVLALVLGLLAVV